MMKLQNQDIQDYVDSCPRDKFKDVRGPVTVSNEFLAELERIDNRLVLRFQPKWYRYAVFCRMDRSDRLWWQPVHIVMNPDKSFRAPDSRDLAAIRKAHWFAMKNGAHAQIDALDRRLAEDEREQDQHRDNVLRSAVSEAARRQNMTMADLGFTAKPFADTRRAARNLEGVRRRN